MTEYYGAQSSLIEDGSLGFSPITWSIARLMALRWRDLRYFEIGIFKGRVVTSKL